MATPTAKAKMAGLAQNRIKVAGPALATLLGVEWPPVLKSKDQDIQRIRELEAFADFLEAAVASQAAKKPGATKATKGSKANHDEAVEPGEAK
jgi:hypothetical protein